MLARLWWKEFRVFGPVWLILLVAAGLLQWFVVSMTDENIRDGRMTSTALYWAVLYAFAVASAAFAGERESKTLGFLDALPVPRPTLWLGKSSFAIVSTMALVLALVGLSELATSESQRSSDNSWLSLVITFGPLLIEGVAWGLLWSAVSKNTLLAAVLTVISVVAVLLPSADERFRWAVSGSFSQKKGDVWEVLLLLGMVALAVGGSLVAVVWQPSWRWSMSRNEAARPSRLTTIQAASTGRSLFWQTTREGWAIGFLIALLGLFYPVANWAFQARMDGILDIFLMTLASLVAGVSVFGSENAIGSRQFLVHHGVKAGGVWWRRLGLWGLWMAGISGIAALAVSFSPDPLGMPMFGSARPKMDRLLLLVFTAANAFAIGVLSGMVIRRRITAALVSVFFWVVLAVPQLVGMGLEMIPGWSLVLVPLILLAISAAWASDWLQEPEGFGRWVRLVGLVVVPFSLLIGSFVGSRAFGVADVGVSYTSAILKEEPIPAGQNAADVYRRAVGLFEMSQSNRLYTATGHPDGLLDALLNDRENFEKTDFSAYLRRNQPAINLAKQASTMPHIRFESIEKMTLNSEDWHLIRNLLILTEAIGLEARDRQFKGDLAGAWSDLLTLLRISEQLASNTPTFNRTMIATTIHQRAVGLAFEWLADPKQTPDTARQALADLKSLPPLPNLSQCLRVESLLVERALDLSGVDLAILLFHPSTGPRPYVNPINLFMTSKILCAPWERERARRLCRQMVAEDLVNVSLDPSERPRGSFQTFLSLRGSQIAHFFLQMTPTLVARLDQEHVSSRALIQSVALVVWKLDHAGKEAEKLEDLVPGLLEKLPIDPDSGRPFGYVRSNGQKLWRPIDLPLFQPSQLKPSKVGQWLLYSVGPDLKDNGGKESYGASKTNPPTGDLLFAVP